MVIFLCLCIICCLVVVETRAITMPSFISQNNINIDQILEPVFESNYDLLITLQQQRIYIQRLEYHKRKKGQQFKIELMNNAQNTYKNILNATVENLHQQVSSVSSFITKEQVKNRLEQKTNPEGKSLKQSLIDKIESNFFWSKSQRDDRSYKMKNNKNISSIVKQLNELTSETEERQEEVRLATININDAEDLLKNDGSIEDIKKKIPESGVLLGQQELTERTKKIMETIDKFTNFEAKIKDAERKRDLKKLKSIENEFKSGSVVFRKGELKDKIRTPSYNVVKGNVEKSSTYFFSNAKKEVKNEV